MIKEFANRYKDKLIESRFKIKQKHDSFLTQLKDASRKHGRTMAELQQLLNQVDIAVESEITTVTQEGQKLKEEILNEMTQVDSQTSERIRFIEEKEAMSRQLLQAIHETLNTAGGAFVAQNYSKLNEQVDDMLKSGGTDSVFPLFSLIQSRERKSLGLKLIKAVPVPMDVTEEVPSPKGKTTILIKTKSDVADGQRDMGLSFISADKIIVYGVHSSPWKFFTETREAEKLSIKQSHNSQVHQLLPYGNEHLVLTYDPPNKYKVSFLNTETVLYAFTDSSPFYYPCTDNLPYYSPYSLCTRKLMVVTFDHQLMILQSKMQTLHVVHLITKVEYEIRLSVGKKVYGLMASSDGKLVLLCEEKKKKEKRLSVIKYDQELQQVVWVSDVLLIHRQKDWLNVAGYLDDLYVISHNHPKELLRLSLSDGCVKNRIPYEGLPKRISDVSLRGNTMAIAGGFEGVGYFSITDMTDVM